MDIADITLLAAHGWAGGEWPGYWGWGYGWPWPGAIWLAVVILFWVGLIALLVWAVRSSARPYRPSQPGDPARETLRRRLAAGEISEEEYERIKRLLWD